MNLCFSTLASPNWSLRQIVDGARAAGLRGVDFRGLGDEIDVTRLPAFDADRDLDSTLALLREARLAMPCLNTSVTLVCPSPDRWQAMLDECHRYARLAGRAGTPLLRIFGGGVPKGMTHEEALGMARRHLRQLVKICQPSNCRPAVETHDDWSTSPRLRELLAEAEPSEAGVLWDVEHPFRQGERPADTVRDLGPYLCHTHFKDSVRVEGKNLPRLMGEGELPLRECVAALKSAGYGGWCCLEAEKRWHPQDCPEPEVTLPQFGQYLRRAWAEA